jgi:hypothetical protein
MLDKKYKIVDIYKNKLKKTKSQYIPNYGLRKKRKNKGGEEEEGINISNLGTINRRTSSILQSIINQSSFGSLFLET